MGPSQPRASYLATVSCVNRYEAIYAHYFIPGTQKTWIIMSTVYFTRILSGTSRILLPGTTSLVYRMMV
jgi:hypothetical protein